jgi:hypothetical protein
MQNMQAGITARIVMSFGREKMSLCCQVPHLTEISACYAGSGTKWQSSYFIRLLDARRLRSYSEHSAMPCFFCYTIISCGPKDRGVTANILSRNVIREVAHGILKIVTRSTPVRMWIL